MASELVNKPLNGNYGSHQPYGLPEQPLPSQGPIATTGSSVPGSFSEESGSLPNAANSSATGASEGSGSVPKDEVGWYFVEQYYTTLSKHPEKLHLFYSKRSQFVSGVEAEKVSVSVGQRAINERIKELDIQDCKVRVSNVDSQESFKNIVVQVIGEMSNKAAPHRKFVQTFVLAEQPNGYFVLNDIFRYINEDEEEEPENESFVENNNTAESAPELEPEVITKSNDSGEGEDNPSQIRKDNEDEASDEDFTEEKPAPDDSVPQGPAALEAAELVQAEDAPAAAITVSENEDLSLQENAEDTSTISEIQPEIPKDPEPTPVASPPMATKHAPIPAQPVVIPNKPAARKTWANLVAEKPTAAPAVSSQGQSSSMSPAPIQSKTNPSSTNRSLTPPTSSSDDTQGQALQSSNAGWQMAGQENGKRQNRQQSVSGSFQKENVLGYIKNVTDRVDASLLKTTLLQYGKLVYFDVSRPKNCAFVEFADAEGYNNAVDANPHNIGGEQIYVEERRPRANAYGGAFGGRGAMRGGRPGSDGRPGNQGRGNYQSVPRGRGGNMAPRGRGQPQVA